MRYFGGKFRIRKKVADILRQYRQGRVYFEPFVGGAWVLQEMDGERIASDGNRALIELYRALQAGWIPPEFVSEDEYNRIKANQKEDALTAFAMIGLSFSGKWAGGYCRDNRGRNYAQDASNSLMKQLKSIKDVEFRHGYYWEHSPEDMLVYCDPPYSGTTGYKGLPAWDVSRFWDTVRRWSENNTVIVSEYAAPSDFTCIAEFPTRIDIHGANRDRVERLFMR